MIAGGFLNQNYDSMPVHFLKEKRVNFPNDDKYITLTLFKNPQDKEEYLKAAYKVEESFSAYIVFGTGKHVAEICFDTENVYESLIVHEVYHLIEHFRKSSRKNFSLERNEELCCCLSEYFYSQIKHFLYDYIDPQQKYNVGTFLVDQKIYGWK